MAKILDKIMDRYNTAKKQSMKDLRLSVSEVDELISYITLVNADNVELSKKIIKVQEDLIETQKNTGILPSDLLFEGDGGTF